MATFERRIEIAAPPERVWGILADIGTIADWNPGVLASHLTGEQREGVGAARHCDLGKGNYLDEETVAWEPGRALTLRIVGTNLPFNSADIRFRMVADGHGSVVTVSPLYELKYGLLGKVLDRVFVRKTYSRGMEALLAGLKRHAEAPPAEMSRAGRTG